MSGYAEHYLEHRCTS